MKSERTKLCIKKKNLYIILSWFLCFGVALILLVYGFATKWTATNSVANNAIVKQAKTLLVTTLIALLPMMILSIMVKDKIKPTIRMINVIFAAYLVGNWFMFIIAGLMLIDTYVISVLINKYKTAIIANKEIDARE